MQEHIESENGRLEREQQFWAKEIVVKIEYKFCPNLTIIDTPGERHDCWLMPSLASPAFDVKADKYANLMTHLSLCCVVQGAALCLKIGQVDLCSWSVYYWSKLCCQSQAFCILQKVYSNTVPSGCSMLLQASSQLRQAGATIQCSPVPSR